MQASRRATGSELAFSIMSELQEAAKTGDRRLFVEKLASAIKDVLANRPACMAAINALRSVALYYLEHGLDKLPEYISSLKESYDSALWKASEVASKRVREGEVILVNSNSLAVRRLLACLKKQGKKISIYVTESRPGNEGLLMAEYAEDLGFDVYLIVDSAARFFMKDVDKVVVGAEAVAVNGAVVSKVGTSLIALVAKEARKRVFTIAPSYKLSFETIYGELLPVPEGGTEALVDPDERDKLPPGYKARAPLYDVTPPEYIDAVATEYGLYAPQAVPILLELVYGSYVPSVPTLKELLEKIEGEKSD